MAIPLPPAVRDEAVAALQLAVRETLDEDVGALAAGALLDAVWREIGPTIYNQAVRDVQERLQALLLDLDAEMHQDEFPESRRSGAARSSQ